jgi:uncharacterized membrane-anchored protein
MDPHLLAFIGILALIFGITYLVVKTSHDQKMAMIEAGINPNDNKKLNHSMLRVAMLMIFVPIGIIVGRGIHEFCNLKASTSGFIFAFLFGGLGLVTVYLIEVFVQRKGNKD